MRRTLGLSLCLIFLVLHAIADPLPLGESREGTLLYPEDASPDTAMLLYHYVLPRADGLDSCSVGIEATYTSMVSELRTFTVPILGEALKSPMRVDLGFTVTCNSDHYVSFHLIQQTTESEETREVHTGHVFARSGSKDGLILSLPNFLGLLEHQDMNDTWLENRQTARVNQVVRQLVADFLLKTYAETLSPDTLMECLEADFFPEEDFFLSEDETPIFILQPGTLFPDSKDAVFIPVSLDDILDAL